jgi:hypothetical protein
MESEEKTKYIVSRIKAHIIETFNANPGVEDYSSVVAYFMYDPKELAENPEDCALYYKLLPQALNELELQLG